MNFSVRDIRELPSVAAAINETVAVHASNLAALMAAEQQFLVNLPWKHRNKLYLFGGPHVSVPRGPRRDEWLMVSAHTPNVRRCISEYIENAPGFGYTVEEFPKLLEDNLPNRLQFNTVTVMSNTPKLDSFAPIKETPRQTMFPKTDQGFRKGEYAIIATTTSKTLQQGLPNRRQFGSVTKLAKRISQYTPI